MTKTNLLDTSITTKNKTAHYTDFALVGGQCE